MTDREVRRKLKKLWCMSSRMNDLLEAHEEKFSHSFGRRMAGLLVEMEEVFVEIQDKVGEEK